MKYLIAVFALVAASSSFAWEGTQHPGLPPSSETSTSDNSILSDVQTRTTTINTKYGTSMTADEIKAAAEQRRAERDTTQEGGPSTVTPPSDTY